MSAQEELKELFAELDKSTDKALAGIRTVREGKMLRNDPSNRVFAVLQFGFLASFVALLALYGAK